MVVHIDRYNKDYFEALITTDFLSARRNKKNASLVVWSSDESFLGFTENISANIKLDFKNTIFFTPNYLFVISVIE